MAAFAKPERLAVILKRHDNRPKFFDDDGTEVNPDLFPKPQLCLSCKKNDDSNEEHLCNLTRLDQRDEPEFKCFAYENIFTK